MFQRFKEEIHFIMKINLVNKNMKIKTGGLLLTSGLH